ncbi:MAG: hypothetical protein EWV58_19865 [Microcystis aeruginosa Ma_MB_F_20061100_S19]|nr:MAG: hypothetical protein EWV58_19865 [Microcystis aeruginosa Ma_MB_F_20061100_S19]
MDLHHIFKFFHHVVAHVDKSLFHPTISKKWDRLWLWLDATLIAGVIFICISVMKFITYQKSQYTQYLNKREKQDRLIRLGFVAENENDVNGMPLEEAKASIRDALDSK